MSGFKNISLWADRHFSKVLVFFVIFYAVGIVGLSVPATKPLFIKLTPLALLLSSAALFLFHTDRRQKTSWVLAIIYLTGFVIEVIGVQSGLIFGNYTYGNGLGIKLFDTPLIIGLNWLMLVYVASSLTNRLKIPAVFQVLVSAIILLVYDLVLEQLAPTLDMWSWENNLVPVQNYIAWFGLALLLSSILKFTHIKTENRLAWLILLCQFVFFATLLFTLKQV